MAEGGIHQISVSSILQTKNGNPTTTKSTITFWGLNLASDDSALVRCRVSNTSGTTAAEPDGFFIISKSAYSHIFDNTMIL